MEEIGLMDVLTSKTYKAYKRLSRYNSFPYYYHTLDNKYIGGTVNYLKQDAPSVLYKVQQNDTYDSIALKYYNNPTYYWIICSFNHIQDPFTSPYIGTYLKIPNISQIAFESN